MIPTSIADPAASAPTTILPLLVVAIMALAGVIAYLFRYYSKRVSLLEKERLEREIAHAKERESLAKEREAWAVERTKLEGYRVELRAEYEGKHRDLLRSVYDDLREYENNARREYAENMETVAGKAAEASDKIGVILDKFYDRFVGGPRRSPHS